MDLDDTFVNVMVIVMTEFLCILSYFTAISGIASLQTDIKIMSGERVVLFCHNAQKSNYLNYGYVHSKY